MKEVKGGTKMSYLVYPFGSMWINCMKRGRTENSGESIGFQSVFGLILTLLKRRLLYKFLYLDKIDVKLSQEASFKNPERKRKNCVLIFLMIFKGSPISQKKTGCIFCVFYVTTWNNICKIFIYSSNYISRSSMTNWNLEIISVNTMWIA